MCETLGSGIRSDRQLLGTGRTGTHQAEQRKASATAQLSAGERRHIGPQLNGTQSFVFEEYLVTRSVVEALRPGASLRTGICRKYD